MVCSDREKGPNCKALVSPLLKRDGEDLIERRPFGTSVPLMVVLGEEVAGRVVWRRVVWGRRVVWWRGWYGGGSTSASTNQVT